MDGPLGNETVGARMQAMRGEIDQGLKDMSARAREMVDWRHYAKSHPWVCLGAAVTLGFLIVPQGRAALRLDSATLSDLAKTGQLVVTPAVARRGPVGTLLATAVRFAVREATAYVGNRAADFLRTTRDSGTSHDDSRFTV